MIKGMVDELTFVSSDLREPATRIRGQSSVGKVLLRELGESARVERVLEVLEGKRKVEHGGVRDVGRALGGGSGDGAKGGEDEGGEGEGLHGCVKGELREGVRELMRVGDLSRGTLDWRILDEGLHYLYGTSYGVNKLRD